MILHLTWLYITLYLGSTWVYCLLP